MTAIFEVLVLGCGYVRARDALRSVIEALMNDGSWTTMALSADVGPVTVKKNVQVRFARAQEATHFDELWRIDWKPENGGPYPDFNGSLSLCYSSGGAAELQLSGKYAPPLGTVGRGFDLVLGQRIASNSCRNLLKELGHRIEERCP